jgi:hypothetical protein
MPVRPHGGVLVDRFVPDSEIANFEERAGRLPRIVVERS